MGKGARAASWWKTASGGKTGRESKVTGFMAKTKVLLADDHTLVRQGLRLLLESEPDIDVAGEAATGREAFRLATQLKPDVVVMDIVMPGLDGLSAAQQIIRRLPASRVVIFSAYSDGDYVHASARAGAAGYVLKDTTTTSADLAKPYVKFGRGMLFSVLPSPGV